MNTQNPRELFETILDEASVWKLDEWFEDDVQKSPFSSIRNYVQQQLKILDRETIYDVFELVLWMRRKIFEDIGTFSGFFYDRDKEELEHPSALSFRIDFGDVLSRRSDLYTIMLSHNADRDPHEFELPQEFNGWNGQFNQWNLDCFARRILGELPGGIDHGLLPAVQLAHNLRIDDPEVRSKIVRLWQIAFFHKNRDQYSQEQLMLSCQKFLWRSSFLVPLKNSVIIDLDWWLNQVMRLIAMGREEMTPLVGVEPEMMCEVAHKLWLLERYSLMEIVDAFPERGDAYDINSVTLTVPIDAPGKFFFRRTYENISGTEYALISSQDQGEYTVLNMAQPDMGFGGLEDIMMSWSLPQNINIQNLFDLLLVHMRELEALFGVATRWFCSLGGKECIESLDLIRGNLSSSCDGFTIHNDFFSVGAWGSIDGFVSLRERPTEGFIFLRANGMVRAKPSLPTGWKERLFAATSRFTQETWHSFPGQLTAPGLLKLTQ